MKNLFVITLTFLLLNNIVAQEQTYIDNTIIIKLKPNNTSKYKKENTLEQIEQILNNDIDVITPLFKNFNTKKSKIPDQFDLSNIYKLKLINSDKLDTYIFELGKLENIEYAELYPIAEVFDTPNDPKIASQYYLNKIQAFEAHQISKGDTNIVIGIVDSGVDLLHEDLKDNYKYNYNDPINNIDDDMDGYVDNYYGWDVADDDNNPQSNVNANGETNYHGTKVSGMASAVTNNGIGIASIGYKTKILPIKTMDNTGRIVAGYEGIIYAADHGCDIINCSWGSNSPSKFAQDVINYATQYKKCLIIAAAGNKSAAIDGRPDTWFYPASYDNVVSVAATGANDIRWNGSSYATTVDVSAPGENVFFTKQFNSYGTGYGTSYASPLVAGLAGLVKAQRPNLTCKQICEQIRVTSDIIDTLSENAFYSKQLGHGRINAYKALTVNDMPAVRIDSFEIIANNISALISGDTLEVTFNATNYLAQVTNTIIRLTTNSEFIVPIDNIFNTGQLNTFESTNNLLNPLKLEVKQDLPYNEKVWFIFEIKAEGYDDYQVFEKNININYLNINENKIQTTLTSNGKLGYLNSDDNIGLGFIYNNSDNFLNTGGIIIGANNSTIASSLLDTEELITTQTIDTLRNSDNELLGKTSFKTMLETGLDINITQTTVASNSELMESTLVYLYSLINKSNQAIENIKLSQFMDWDLYHYEKNQTEYNDELNLFYTYSNTDKVIYTGICLLNNMTSVPYGFDLVEGGNGGIDITNGFSNELKWFTMNNSRSNAGNKGDTINVAAMLTTNFFTIEPNDSIEIAFAHIVGSHYLDLVKKTEKVRDTYLQTNVKNRETNLINTYPNPAINNITITCAGLHSQSTVQIYDQTGRLHLSKTYEECEFISINIGSLEPGIYIINVFTKTDKYVAKIIKIP